MKSFLLIGALLMTSLSSFASQACPSGQTEVRSAHILVSGNKLIIVRMGNATPVTQNLNVGITLSGLYDICLQDDGQDGYTITSATRIK